MTAEMSVYAEFDASRIGRTMRLVLGDDRGNAVYAEFLGSKEIFHTPSDWSGCSVSLGKDLSLCPKGLGYWGGTIFVPFGFIYWI